MNFLLLPSLGLNRVWIRPGLYGTKSSCPWVHQEYVSKFQKYIYAYRVQVRKPQVHFRRRLSDFGWIQLELHITLQARIM